MSWCHAKVWAAAGQRSLGRAGISSLGMLESLRSPGSKGARAGPGGQVELKVRGGSRKNRRRKEGKGRGSVRDEKPAEDAVGKE